MRNRSCYTGFYCTGSQMNYQFKFGIYDEMSNCYVVFCGSFIIVKKLYVICDIIRFVLELNGETCVYRLLYMLRNIYLILWFSKIWELVNWKTENVKMEKFEKKYEKFKKRRGKIQKYRHHHIIPTYFSDYWLII